MIMCVGQQSFCTNHIIIQTITAMPMRYARCNNTKRIQNEETLCMLSYKVLTVVKMSM
jgi:hypothetical protein